MKISTKFRKICAAVMAALIINISVFNSYSIKAEASSMVLYGLMEALYGIWGYTTGFGDSGIGMSSDARADIASDLIAQWTAGKSLQLQGGDVIPDLRDAAFFYEFIKTTYLYTVDYGIKNFGDKNLEALNQKSYKASGTVATESMADDLYTAMSMYEENPEQFQKDLDCFFNIASFSDALMLDVPYARIQVISDALFSLIALKSKPDVKDPWYNTISNSVYNDDYAMVSLNVNGTTFQGFRGSKSLVTYSDNSYCMTWASRPCTYFGYKFNGNYAFFFMASDAPFDFIYNQYDSSGALVSEQVLVANKYSDNLYGYNMMLRTSNIASSNLIFTSNPNNYSDSDLRSYLSANYSTTLAPDVGFVGKYYDAIPANLNGKINSFMNSASIDKIVNLYKKLLLLTTAGTETAIDDIVDAIDVTPAPGDVDTEHLSFLEKILAALLAIPKSIFGVFETPLLKLQSALDVIPSSISDIGDLIVPFPQLLINIKDAVDVIPRVLIDLSTQILTIPGILINDIADVLTKIKADTAAISESLAGEDAQEPNNGHSNDFKNFLNGLIIIILILIKLIMIFFHCMEFIIAIFNIRAGTTFLPEEMIMGLDYIKSLVIPGIGLSVYDFMIGLVYIYIVFYAVRILRINIDRIKMPGRR